MPLQHISATLASSSYRTSNKLKCQWLELLLYLHLHLYLNYPPYLPLFNLHHKPWLRYHHLLHPLPHLPNLYNYLPFKTNDDVLQFFYLRTHFLLMTKGGEIRMIVLKTVFLIKSNLKVFIYIYIYIYILFCMLYFAAILIIFIHQFLAMLELWGV